MATGLAARTAANRLTSSAVANLSSIVRSGGGAPTTIAPKMPPGFRLPCLEAHQAIMLIRLLDMVAEPALDAQRDDVDEESVFGSLVGSGENDTVVIISSYFDESYDDDIMCVAGYSFSTRNARLLDDCQRRSKIASLSGAKMHQ
jgi:hypothetical protein